MARFATKDMRKVMQKHYDDRENADLTLVCGLHELKVHSFVICPRSSFFDAICKGSFKEAQNKRIELPDDNPNIIHKMISYCYYLVDEPYYDNTSYFVDVALEHQFISPIHTNAHVYTVAEKFDMKYLKKVAGDKFSKALAGSPKDIAPLALDVLPFVYSMTPDSDRDLRDRLANYVCQNYKDIESLPAFSTLGATPAFLIDVLHIMASKLSPSENSGAKRPRFFDFS